MKTKRFLKIILGLFVDGVCIGISIPFFKGFAQIIYLSKLIKLPHSIMNLAYLWLFEAILLVILGQAIPLIIWWKSGKDE